MSERSNTDSRLHFEIVQAIARETAIDDSDIEVLVYETGVMLNGTVPTAPMRQAAERCARGIPGVKGVTNNLSALLEEGRPLGRRGTEEQRSSLT